MQLCLWPVVGEEMGISTSAHDGEQIGKIAFYLDYQFDTKVDSHKNIA